MKNYTNRLATSVLLVLAFSVATFAQSQEVEVITSKDNTLYENSTGSLSNGAGDHLFFGRTNQGAIRRALMAFDVAANIPAGAVIQSVVLRVKVTKTIVPAHNATLHRVLANWGEGTSNASANEGSGAGSTVNDATWIHTFFDGQMWQTPGGDFDDGNLSLVSVGNAGGTVDFPSTDDFVAVVQSWLDSPDENFGLLILGDESTNPTTKRIGSKDGAEADRPRLVVTYSVATANERSELPQFLSSLDVYPNPVAGPAHLAFEISDPRSVRVDVIDVVGRLVATPLESEMPAGSHSLTLDVGHLTPGLYLVRLASGGETVSRSLFVQ